MATTQANRRRVAALRTKLAQTEIAYHSVRAELVHLNECLKELADIVLEYELSVEVEEARASQDYITRNAYDNFISMHYNKGVKEGKWE